MAGASDLHLRISKNDQIISIDLCPNLKNSEEKPVTVGGITYSLCGTADQVKLFTTFFSQLPPVAFRSVESLKAACLLHQMVDQIAISTSNKVNSVGIESIKGEKKFDLYKVVNDVCEAIKGNYVFPKIGEQCVKYLQNELKTGGYQHIYDPEVLAAAISADLRLISEDKHLSLHFPKPKEEAESKTDLQGGDAYTQAEGANFGLVTKILSVDSVDNNDYQIGYLSLSCFGAVTESKDPDPKHEEQLNANAAARRKAVIKAVDSLKTTSGIIIDLRNNGGGSPEAVQLLCSCFLDAGIPLNTIRSRPPNSDDFVVEEYNTLSHSGLKRDAQLLKTPLYVLVSHKTFSAAEEFTNNLKVLGRAKIIGEVTGGGANPGGAYPVDKKFQLFVPHGQSINPYDGSNWEGVGVIPDHVVPADSALEECLKLHAG